MKLSKYTEYAFELLIFLANNADKKDRHSLKELAEHLEVTKNNLAKITARLVELDVLESFPGWTGGVTLKTSPKQIKLGDVLSAFEPQTALNNDNLQKLVSSAEEDFVSKLNKSTLSDLVSSIKSKQKTKP